MLYLDRRPDSPSRKRAQAAWLLMRPISLSKLIRNTIVFFILVLIFSGTYLINNQDEFGLLDSKVTNVKNTHRKLAVFIDGTEQATALKPLVCKFLQTTDSGISLSLIVTGHQRGLSASGMIKLIEESPFPCPATVVDLSMKDVGRLSLPVGDKLDTVSNISLRVIHVLKHLNPEIMLYVKEPNNSAIRGLITALASFENVITIGVPIDEVEHVEWLADLTFDTLKSWNTPKFHLQVITQDRPDSLSRLLRSLESSVFLGDEMPLTINMDRGADPITLDYTHKFYWKFGQLSLRHRVVQGGLLPAVVESYYPSHSHEYVIILEDDVEVSPFFYVWVKYCVLKYRYGTDKQSNRLMYGVSLYGPKTSELFPNGRKKFNPSVVLRESHFPERSPYLSQVPCSWGAVYFPEIWREFHEFVTARLEDMSTINFQNITVPGSRSNRWRNSWKRIFIELIYLRGYVMLYPNFENFTSLSTNHAESGMHIRPNPLKRPVSSVFEVPLMSKNVILDELPRGRLADYDSLPVMDLWGKVVSTQILVQRGFELHVEISECDPRPEYDRRYSARDLLCVNEEEKEEAMARWKAQIKENLKIDIRTKDGKQPLSLPAQNITHNNTITSNDTILDLTTN